MEKYAKNPKEQILENLRKDATSLQRLRHPHILSVIEALSEERSTLAFATKPIVGTVAQLLDNNRHELTSLEMKCGILDVSEALQFLHQDAKTAHLGFSTHAVFIDPQGKWLLGSMGHSLPGMQWGQLVDCPFAFGADKPGDLSAEPPARYAAPEMCAIPAKCGLESDMFALGLLTYELMSTDRQPLLRSAPRGYSSNILRQSAVPADLYQVLLKLLSPSPAERLTIAGFINSEFFHDVNVRAIRFLEQLNEKEDVQRVTFLKGLPKLLQDPQSTLCGQRVLRERVLPRLCSALLFPSLYGVVVPIIMAMIKRERVTDCAHFQAKMWPALKPLFSAKEIPIEVVTLFLKELDVLVNLAPSAETQAVLLPFLLRCLELQEPVILHEVLEKVPYLHKKFEYRQVKDQILPRMLQLLLGTSAVKIKVQVLMGLSRIFEIFDKSTINDVILPAFEKLTKSDRTPAVCMCLLGCFDAMSKHLGHKLTSEKILPLICPLLVEESLSAEQFETQLSVCKKLMSRVEAARRKDYDTRKEAQAEAGQALGSANSAAEQSKPVKDAEPQDFESLLFAGTTKAVQQSVVPPPVLTAPTPANPIIKGPPPPAASSAVKGDLLGGSFDPSPSAPSASGLMGGFDPFAAAPLQSLASGGFDPFASAGVTMAPSAPMPVPGGPPNPGMWGVPASGYPAPSSFGMGAPQGLAQQGPGLGAQGLGPQGVRNLTFDPFAGIEDR